MLKCPWTIDRCNGRNSNIPLFASKLHPLWHKNFRISNFPSAAAIRISFVVAVTVSWSLFMHLYRWQWKHFLLLKHCSRWSGLWRYSKLVAHMQWLVSVLQSTVMPSSKISLCLANSASASVCGSSMMFLNNVSILKDFVRNQLQSTF